MIRFNGGTYLPTRPDPTRPDPACCGHVDLDVFSVLDINPDSVSACFSFFSLGMLDRPFSAWMPSVAFWR